MALSLTDYLLNLSPMATDGNVANVLAKRELDGDTDISSIDEEDRDLAEADVLMGIVMLPSTTGGEEEQVGQWKKKVSGNTFTYSDRRNLISRARYLYDKWDEEWPYPTSGVRVHYSGMEI